MGMVLGQPVHYFFFFFLFCPVFGSAVSGRLWKTLERTILWRCLSRCPGKIDLLSVGPAPVPAQEGVNVESSHGMVCKGCRRGPRGCLAAACVKLVTLAYFVLQNLGFHCQTPPLPFLLPFFSFFQSPTHLPCPLYVLCDSLHSVCKRCVA